MSDKTKWIKPEADKPVETSSKPAEAKKQSTREKMYGKQNKETSGVQTQR